MTLASVTTEDGKIDYSAHTGTLLQTADDGDEKAKVFFVAYTKVDAEQPKRPVTFCFNGGPGSSSVWLHLGMLGPQRIVFPDDATPLRPPYKLNENAQSLLSVSDLVFIDPVSTGYSRPTEDEKKSQFHGYREDVRSVSQFVHDWTTHFGRWESPKYLLGESYGGIRAAGVASYLQDRYNMELNGAVVISGAINFQTLRFYGNNDVPCICFLPTYAATAWYHKQLSHSWQEKPVSEVVAAAEAFALGDYAAALIQGTSLAEDEKKKIADRYAELTGLDADFVLRCNLRVSQPRFGKELLREQGRTVGRFDSRYQGIDRDAAGERIGYDPSGAAIFGPFTATINQYLSETLNYRQPRTYEILTGNVQPWNYDNFAGRYVDASEELRSVMTANPYFKLYVACGYYDLATPHFAMKYTLDHLGLPAERLDNIQVEHFEGGHMMYIYEPAMAKLYDDLKAWYTESDGS
ncbi:MAG: peptidase S10 [Planctomycetota bacterium]